MNRPLEPTGFCVKGNIPLGWKSGELLEFLELQRGVDLPRQTRREGKFQIFGSNGVLGYHDTFILPGPGVITGRSGTIGKLFYTEEKYWPLNTSLYVKSFKGNHPKFVYFKLDELGLDRFSTGTGVPTLNRNVAHKEVVVFPPLPEQQKIAAILTAVDDKLDVIARQIVATQTLKQGLMQTLFSRGVGTQDANGRWVPHTEFKESELGEIPARWDIKKVVDVAEVNPSRNHVTENDLLVTFLGMADISENGNVIARQTRCYKEVAKGFTSFKDNDVLVAKITPCFENGKGALVSKLENGIGFGSTEFHVIRVNSALTDARFIHAHTRSLTFRKQGERNMAGSAGQKRVPTEFVKAYSIAIPPLVEQGRIADILGEVDAKMGSCRAKQAHYQTLKRGLMQKLLTGEWRVKLDVEALNGH